MGAVQTGYVASMDPGLPGMIANMETWNAITGICETAGGIPFGVAVSQGAADDGCVLTSTTNNKVLGLSRRDTTQPYSLGVDKYAQKANVGIMTQGVMWVTAGETVAARDDVLFDTATNKFVKTASGTTVAVPGCKFDMAGANNGLVKVAIR